MSASGAAAQDFSFVNRFALVDAADGGLVPGYLAETAERGDGPWIENGARAWLIAQLDGPAGGPWYYAYFDTTGDTPNAPTYVTDGFVRTSDLRIVALVQPGSESARGTGAPPSMTDVEIGPRPPFAVESDDGYLNLRAGPGVANRVLTQIPTGAEVHLFACGDRRDGSAGRWCFASYEATGICDDAYCPGPQHYGYLYTAELVVSCQLQSTPEDPSDVCYGRAQSGVGPSYESTRR